VVVKKTFRPWLTRAKAPITAIWQDRRDPTGSPGSDKIDWVPYNKTRIGLFVRASGNRINSTRIEGMTTQKPLYS
jgi:hypothetical protein